MALYVVNIFTSSDAVERECRSGHGVPVGGKFGPALVAFFEVMADFGIGEGVVLQVAVEILVVTHHVD